MASPTAFALALQEMDGVGRVTTGRLLKHFDTYERLRACPREQVLLRIKGAPNAEALVKRLFDEEAMRARLDAAAEAVAGLAEKQVRVLASPEAAWPTRLDALPRAQRPALLYAFGSLDVLSAPSVAFFARPPLDGTVFEAAQSLAARLAEAGAVPMTGATHGFDAVIHKRADGQPSAFVAHCGLGVVPNALRPVIAAAVRAGGLLLSSFPMRHGPFDHDDKERALLLAALAGACVFAPAEPKTPEHVALEWALGAGRPVFGLGSSASFPDGVRPLTEPADFGAVLDAAQQ